MTRAWGMIEKNNDGHIFCAVDTDDLDRATSLSSAISPYVGGVKLGIQFFSTFGPPGVEVIRQRGLPIFLDLKLFDIPNTVAGAVHAAARLAPAMLTLHASGGRAMMEAAVRANQEAADTLGQERSLLLGVTVLTSLGHDDLCEVGVQGDLADQVLRLASLAQDSGLDGVVCSAHEIEALRRLCGGGFKLVVPGIRPTLAGSDDQKRVLTPAEALNKGADYLVIGRPITGDKDPVDAVQRIAAEVDELVTLGS